VWNILPLENTILNMSTQFFGILHTGWKKATSWFPFCGCSRSTAHLSIKGCLWDILYSTCCTVQALVGLDFENSQQESKNKFAFLLLNYWGNYQKRGPTHMGTGICTSVCHHTVPCLECECGELTYAWTFHHTIVPQYSTVLNPCTVRATLDYHLK